MMLKVRPATLLGAGSVEEQLETKKQETETIERYTRIVILREMSEALRGCRHEPGVYACHALAPSDEGALNPQVPFPKQLSFRLP